MSVAAAAGLVTGVQTDTTLLVSVLAVAVTATSLGYTGIREAKRALQADAFQVTRTDLGNAAAVAVAAPMPYVLSVQVGVGPIVASALVGICAHLLTEAYGAPAYCGSFVGMATPAADADLGAVVAAGLVAAAVFVTAKRQFNGFGGKLGTTAFVGCLSVAALGGFVSETASIPEPTLERASSPRQPSPSSLRSS